MTDLVERLRAVRSKWVGVKGILAHTALINPDGPEAASTIEALSERIAETRTLLATAKALVRVKYGNLDADVNEFIDRVEASLTPDLSQ